MVIYIKCEARPVVAVVVAVDRIAVVESEGRRTTGDDVAVTATTINSVAGVVGL